MSLLRSRGIARTRRHLASRPTLEGLEGRLLLYSTLGAQWSQPVRVTYSLIPDGTSFGGTPTNLFQTMNAVAPTATWEQAIEKAAAVWEAVANINLVQIPDNGAAIGTSGNQQGDPRFGDIRLGGIAQSSGQLAFAYAPPPFNGGTDAGDIFFNTAQPWSVSGGTYDLETVAIHEFGHALGMAHSTISSADMYASYTGVKQGPTSDDTSGIDSIYGAPATDPYETLGNNAVNNNTASRATPITSDLNSSGQATLTNAAINPAGDVDWYYVVSPNQGPLTVSVQATGLSSLSPAIAVYFGSPSSLTLQGQASAPNSFGGTATVSGIKTTGKAGYYIKVTGADSGYSGMGTYGLLVNFGTSTQPPISPPSTVVPAQPDQNPATLGELIGWTINGVFTPYGGNDQILQVNTSSTLNSTQGNLLNSNSVNTLFTLGVGSISGYGDTLDVGAYVGGGHSSGRSHGPQGHHPAGSHRGHGPTGVLTRVEQLRAHDQAMAAWGHHA